MVISSDSKICFIIIFKSSPVAHLKSPTCSQTCSSNKGACSYLCSDRKKVKWSEEGIIFTLYLARPLARPSVTSVNHLLIRHGCLHYEKDQSNNNVLPVQCILTITSLLTINWCNSKANSTHSLDKVYLAAHSQTKLNIVPAYWTF